VLIAACIPDLKVLGFFKLAGLTMLGMYLLGTGVALVMAWVFKKTLLRGETPMLILELPPYKMPVFKVILRHMWDRSKLFLRRAGTVILGINILLWFLATYPRSSTTDAEFSAKRAEVNRQVEALNGSTNQLAALETQLSDLATHEASEQLRHSFAGRLGHLIEPTIAPLGFDWKMGIGIVASFAAREVFVSTMATVYSVEQTDDEESSMKRLAEMLKQQERPDGKPVYTTLTGLTLMVFYVFALQCVSTVAVVRRETNSWKWPLFQWLYMGALAWGLAFATRHFGLMLGMQ
jgi:ferrous iron transport protein B